MRPALRALVLAAAVCVAAMACDSGPSGPGELSVVVESTTGVAAAVIEFPGSGIVDVRDGGSVRAFGGATTAGAFRVVAIQTGSATLEFRLSVEDLGAPLPTATLIEAAGPDNRPVLETSQVSVRVVR